MRLRGVHIKGMGDLSDISFESRDASNPDVIYIHGDSSSGKTRVLETIRSAYSSAVSVSSDVNYSADMVRVDFDTGDEIISLSRRERGFDSSPTLQRIGSFGGDESIIHSILYYSSGRNMLAAVSGGASVSQMSCILSDCHLKSISDSIIMIDDWDMYLDVDVARQFYLHIVRHFCTKGNQLVLTSCRSPSYVGSVVRLSRSGDLVSSVVGSLSSTE